MTASSDPHAAFTEVLRLTAALTDRVLNAQIRNEPIPEDQIRALMNAVHFLRDHDVPWPPMLTQALHGIGPLPDETCAPSVDHLDEDSASADDDLRGLSRFFAGFRKGKSEGQ